MTRNELKDALEKLNLTQRELAKRLNVRAETVNRWLRPVNGKSRKIPGPVAAAINSWVKAEMEARPSEDAI